MFIKLSCSSDDRKSFKELASTCSLAASGFCEERKSTFKGGMKDQLGLCSLNCHAPPMTGNRSRSWRVLAHSLRVVSAKRGNPPSKEA